jgi:hypothetical protein
LKTRHFWKIIQRLFSFVAGQLALAAPQAQRFFVTTITSRFPELCFLLIGNILPLTFEAVRWSSIQSARHIQIAWSKSIKSQTVFGSLTARPSAIN